MRMGSRMAPEWTPASLRVIGLVGPAGTGKSHRALWVADTEQVRAVIDDGLLIEGGKIRAGRSAKSGRTRLDAVRLAIFHYPDHAQSVIDALARLRPEGVLILGTSEAMISRICHNLGLAKPGRMIHITDVASPEEIEAALVNRRMQGKHVIPAPTFEVKRRFAQQLVAPLRLFYRRGDSAERLMVEKSVVRPPYTGLGRLFIAEGVIEALFSRFLRDEPVIANVLRTSVRAADEGVALTADVEVRYIPDILGRLKAAQMNVYQQLEEQVGVTVLSLDLSARSLAFDEMTQDVAS